VIEDCRIDGRETGIAVAPENPPILLRGGSVRGGVATLPPASRLEHVCGVATATRGTATATGDGPVDAITVAHGLDGVPRTITITPRTPAASRGHYVSDRDAETFTIAFDDPPGVEAGPVTVGWTARTALDGGSGDVYGPHEDTDHPSPAP